MAPVAVSERQLFAELVVDSGRLASVLERNQLVAHERDRSIADLCLLIG